MENSNQSLQAQEVQSQMPSPVNNSSGSKLIPIILGVAAAIAIAIGAYVLGAKQSETPVLYPAQTTPSPTPIDETANPDLIGANWKTYTQEGLWEIKYPASWYIIEEKSNLLGLSDGKDVPRGPEAGSIYLQVASGSKSSSYDELFKKEVGTVEKGSKLTTTTQEKLTVTGYPAVRLTEETSSTAATEPSYTVAVYIKGSSNVKISGLALKGKDDFTNNSLQTFNQVLSTFKFTDQTQQACPTPPTCPAGKNLIHGDPNPSVESQCPRYQCL